LITAFCLMAGGMIFMASVSPILCSYFPIEGFEN
jgi:hypothetical protein